MTAARASIAAIGAILLTGAASAEPARYSWHGQGTNVMGSGKCVGYTMDVYAAVDNNRISGSWQQRGRVVRQFDFPIAADGSFGGKVADLTVKGAATKDGQVRFDMKGYCIFGGMMKKAE
jgi:hypothetical protein